MMVMTLLYQGYPGGIVRSVKADSLIKMSDCNISFVGSSGTNDSYTYTGDAITPEIVVTLNNAVIDSENYTYTFSNNVNVAKNTATAAPSVTIKGIESKGYTGTYTRTFTIAQASFANASALGISISLSSSSMTYAKDDDNPPAYTVTYNGRTLVENIDYTCGSSSNADDGVSVSAMKGTLTFSGKGNFTGSMSTTYKITQADISTQTQVILSEYNFAYDGNAHEPVPTVIDTISGCELEQDVDYTVTYSNNTQPGTATVKITGKGKYKTSSYQNVNFTIVSSDVETKDISGATITVPTSTYTGKAVEPDLTVTDSGTTLVKDKDYVVSYANNISAGTKATATIYGIGEYIGTKTKTFTISKRNLSNVTVTVDTATYNFGNYVRPSVIVYDSENDRTLTAGVDYKTPTYTNNTSVGEGTVTINYYNSTCNYTGSKTATFEILPLDMSSRVEVSGDEASYTGSEVTTNVTVTCSEATLTEGTDYDITYSNNI